MMGGLDPEIAARIGEIKMPTLVLWGSRDSWIGPENAAWFGTHLPNATVHVLDGVGHMPMLESPAETAAVMDAFLQGTTG
jgi:pimeloyl-ACP methyl ester carboxylesterase